MRISEFDQKTKIGGLRYVLTEDKESRQLHSYSTNDVFKHTFLCCQVTYEAIPKIEARKLLSLIHSSISDEKVSGNKNLLFFQSLSDLLFLITSMGG